MKYKQILPIVFSIICLSLFSCKKDTDVNIDTFKIEKEVEKVTVGTTTASISGTYIYSGRINSLKVRVGESEQLFGSDVYIAEVSGKAYSVNINGLQSGTLYYYRYEVDYGASEDFLTEIDEFTTLSESPTVKTLEVLALDSTTFRVKCEVVADGGSDVTERGICWNTYGDPTLDDETMQHATGGVGQYTIRMEHLAMGKKYYVRAYAKSMAGIGFGEEMEFETTYTPGMPVSIALSCNPESGGTVSGAGSYAAGTQCTVTATANPTYTFVNWTENGTQVASDASYTFTVSVERNLVANFTKQTYVISAQVVPENSGNVEGAGGYDSGDACTLTATAKTGYTFVNWTKNGNVVSTDAEYTFTVTESATYVAHFQAKRYTISVSSSPSNGGTVTGGGIMSYGQTCTVQAMPAEGYVFANWTDDGDVVSTDANYTFTVTGNRILVANFTYNGNVDHEYVDLGLPSGLLWATCNVGANSPEDYGDYFAWGETETKVSYTWYSYQYCTGGEYNYPYDNMFSKYCTDANYGYNGFTDNLTILQPEDDAASANWGSGWRMPTKEEFEELYNNTTNTWATRNEVNGRLFTATNGNSLFLPAAGFRGGTNLYDNGTGCYWSRSLDTSNQEYARRLGFDSGSCDMGHDYRVYGQSVRPVRSSRQN